MTQQLPKFLHLTYYNQIPVLAMQHPALGDVAISLQGAQLLKWQPLGEQNIFWLSECEPFQLGSAIRGGVPICYPWFGNVKSPAHGTARLRLWQLTETQIDAHRAQLTFALPSEDSTRTVAKITMSFHISSEDEQASCRLTFQHLDDSPAQLALHSYFNLDDINQTEIHDLPTRCFNSLTQQNEEVPTPRVIDQNVDCIYPAQITMRNRIVDLKNARTLCLTHDNASDVVLWNPWHKPTSAMSKIGYQTMLCLETARIHRPLTQGESVAVEISVSR